MTYELIGPDGRPYRSPVPGALGGHRRGRLYGRLDCPSALRAIASGGYVRHRVFFPDAATALAAGYRPCAVCLPEAHAAWKAETAPAAEATRTVEVRETEEVMKTKEVLETEEVTEAVEVVGLVRGQRPRVGAVVVGHGRGGEGLAEAFVAVWEGTVLDVVSWPEEAASWLRQARRFVAGAPDAWVVAGAPLGWARMSERLRRSTDWDPSRTYGFAATAQAVALAAPGTLEGMRGADRNGQAWRIGRNLIYQETP